MSWKEYKMENRAVADWLPWGGMTHPNILEGKEGSLVGVLSYMPGNAKDSIRIPSLQNGWAVWSERQSHPSMGVSQFLAVCWNPFEERGTISNGFSSKPIPKERAREAFAAALETLHDAIGAFAPCHILEYQELLDYFSFALSMGEQKVLLPEVPLYLDALLSQDLPLVFEGNAIYLGDKEILVISLPSGAEDGQREVMEKALAAFPFRSVRRLLLFSREEAEKAMEAYCAAWCAGRRSVQKLMLEGILGEMSGYYADSLVLLVPKTKAAETGKYIKGLLDLMELPYLLEDYNRKDVWWGSLPGLFRANVMPPLTGFSGLGDLLFHEGKGDKDHVPVRPL